MKPETIDPLSLPSVGKNHLYTDRAGTIVNSVWHPVPSDLIKQ